MAISRRYDNENIVDHSLSFISLLLIAVVTIVFIESCKYEKTIEMGDGCTLVVGNNGVDTFYWHAHEQLGVLPSMPRLSKESACKAWLESVLDDCIDESRCDNGPAKWKDLVGHKIIMVEKNIIRTNRAIFSVADIPEIKSGQRLVGKKISSVRRSYRTVLLIFDDGGRLEIDFSPGTTQEIRRL